MTQLIPQVRTAGSIAESATVVDGSQSQEQTAEVVKHIPVQCLKQRTAEQITDVLLQSEEQFNEASALAWSPGNAELSAQLLSALDARAAGRRGAA